MFSRWNRDTGTVGTAKDGKNLLKFYISRRASFGTFVEDRCGTYRKATNAAERSWPVPGGARRKLPSTERLELHDKVCE